MKQFKPVMWGCLIPLLIMVSRVAMWFTIPETGIQHFENNALAIMALPFCFIAAWYTDAIRYD